MNHTYHLLWSNLQKAMVVVGETVRSRGKKATKPSLFVGLLMAAVQLQAGPLGGQVVAGAGAIDYAAKITNIQQHSERLSLTWQNFDVSAQESVNFVQPSPQSIAVNRILDTNGSTIHGRINANGQVYLINPNGILFGANAQVNVGALVASTLDISDAQLSASEMQFEGQSQAAVVNYGKLNANADDASYLALLAKRVDNQGHVSASGGTVALAAGNKVTLRFAGKSLLDMEVDESLYASEVNNGGIIEADGGMVLMKAGSRDSLQRSVVNTSGVVRAQSVANKDGKIVLLAGMQAGTTTVAGTLDASAPSQGDGGFIDTSAAAVTVAEGTRVTTQASNGRSGTWLIDPTDYTVAASDGDISGATLTSNLANGSITIETLSTGTEAGNIIIDDQVSWSNNQLILKAHNNIVVKATMDVTGTGSLSLEYGLGAAASGNTSRFITDGGKINLPASTTNFTTRQGSNGTTKNYTVITSLGEEGSTTMTDLQGINNLNNLNKNYVLGSDIDASATKTWTNSWHPLGMYIYYDGDFDGLGHTISGLNVTGAHDYTPNALFSKLRNNSVQNLIIKDSYVSATQGPIGVLAGLAENSNIRNVAINNSDVYGDGSGMYAGGLVGKTTKNTSVIEATVDSASSVSGSANWIVVAGLVGLASGSSIYRSGVAAPVTGHHMYVAGLVGENRATMIEQSWSSGDITSSDKYYVGGLVGHMQGVGAGIVDSFSSSNVKASNSRYVGGLVGSLTSDPVVSNSYVTGSVTGLNAWETGGLVGRASGTLNITSSYWDQDTTGQTASVGSTSGNLTTEQMQTQGSYSGWDFDDIWNPPSSGRYPTFKYMSTPLTVTVANANAVYDGDAYDGGFKVSYEGFVGTDTAADLGGVLSYTTSPTDVGTYTITPSGLSSSTYAISFIPGTLTITKADLSITGLSIADKTYDAGVSASIKGEAIISPFGTDIVALSGTGTAIFTDKNVGNNKSVTVSGYSLTGADAPNYNLLQPAGLSASIGKLGLALGGLSSTQAQYDMDTAPGVKGKASIQPLGQDQVQVTGSPSVTFASKSPGKNKTLVVKGLSLAGIDSGNYYLLPASGLTADLDWAGDAPNTVMGRLVSSIKIVPPIKPLMQPAKNSHQASQQIRPAVTNVTNLPAPTSPRAVTQIALGGNGSAAFIMGSGINMPNASSTNSEE